MTTAPEFVNGSPLVASAYRFAIDAHTASSASNVSDPEHSVTVAAILADDDFGDDVVAAALLHDVLERTRATPGEVRGRFGDAVADLVLAVTEDSSIEAYEDRKAELRRRSCTSGRSAAAIVAADKLASVRRKAAERDDVPAPALEHYERTLEGLRRDHPWLPWLDELEQALGALREQVSRA